MSKPKRKTHIKDVKNFIDIKKGGIIYEKRL